MCYSFGYTYVIYEVGKENCFQFVNESKAKIVFKDADFVGFTYFKRNIIPNIEIQKEEVGEDKEMER